MTADVDSRASETLGLWRRQWPELVLLLGVALFVAAIPIGKFTSDRLVLLGSFNAFVIAGCLVIGSVWCLGIFLVGRVVKSVSGRTAEVIGILVTLLVFFGALALSGIIGLATAFGAATGPRYFLDVPGSPSRYLVTTITFGETRLTLHRGNGTVYEQVDVYPPIVDRSVSFDSSYRVETDEAGRSFLVYPKSGGGDAKVFLPPA